MGLFIIVVLILGVEFDFCNVFEGKWFSLLVFIVLVVILFYGF